MFHCIDLACLAHYAFMEHVNRPRRHDNGVPVHGQGANCGWVDKSAYDAERSLVVKAAMPYLQWLKRMGRNDDYNRLKNGRVPSEGPDTLEEVTMSSDVRLVIHHDGINRATQGFGETRSLECTSS